jgi:hypothetical protein
MLTGAANGMFTQNIPKMALAAARISTTQAR